MIVSMDKAHESSHWLFTKVHGYRPDPLRTALRRQLSSAAGSSSAIPSAPISVSQTGARFEDPLVALGSKPEDSGVRTTDMLLGATSKLVSFADGKTASIKT